MNNGVEAVCFECGLKYSSWNNEETPYNVHRRLAPSCRFITRNGTRNVPIHSDGVLVAKSAHQGLKENVINSENTPIDVAKNTGTSEQNETVNLEKYENSVTQENVPREEPAGHLEIVSSDVNTQALETQKRSSYENSSPTNVEIRQKTQCNNSETFQNTDMLSKDEEWPCARFRDYVTKTSRKETYKGWTSNWQNQSPDKMAEAGLVYIGLRDCVRCFYCGGGLQGWEAEDQPWVEHARWYPDCGYVLKCKGRDFVKRWHGPTNNGEYEVSETARTDMAKQTLVETGFDRTEVNKAAEIYERENVDRVYSATDLMAILERNDVLGKIQDVTNSGSSEVKPNEQTVENQLNMRTYRNVKAEGEFIKRNDTTVTNAGSRIKKQDIKPLFDENKRLKRQLLCKICLDNEIGVVFLPCGHLVSCKQCAAVIRKCPMCRKQIKGVVRTYIS